jgi:hypothetical protein
MQGDLLKAWESQTRLAGRITRWIADRRLKGAGTSQAAIVSIDNVFELISVFRTSSERNQTLKVETPGATLST